ncbi:putative Nucleotidyl transferase [Nitrospina gracilis 3/211]|uniref:Putative Nucleotidyl transferase n=1 Tax=Nitrospina gracilis (strain 3/211) TaxID=1266370 RepID=M1YWC6_NITG3|nr:MULTISPECIES: nucleotidyltransferase family protein [Nitrospina]MCF8722830.1 NDP-sugar pyrophosphorylase family protein [Nitrospina sp. Nb-3]CCQ89788.1 putative Nucleotidyl transferase [Nitrospina gracilis 3/211]
MIPGDPSCTDVLILCGGRGTRLQSVAADKPKPMVEVDNRPFLDLLIDHAATFGFRRFVLLAGHHAEAIASHYETPRDGLAIEVSVEPQAMGTGGAVRHAQPLIQSDPFLVLNGDSFCRVDLTALLHYHFQLEDALAIIALAPKKEAADYGGVTVDEAGRILRFDEKNPEAASGLVNAGLYVFNCGVLDRIPAGRTISLETEVFPALAGQGLYGFTTDSELYDIGTPERLDRARRELKI